MTQNAIRSLINVREGLIQSDSKGADQIEADIITAIKQNFNEYPCDFIIECLTCFGQAPNVMYDDDGRFAVSGAGFSPVPIDGPAEGAFTVFVKREQWKPTIRKALWDYLTSKADE